MFTSKLRTICLSAALLSGSFLGIGPAAAQQPATPFPNVWLSAASESADFLDLFQKHTLWARARAEIQVMQFTPGELDGHNSLIVNNFADIAATDAFRLVRKWGLQTAIEAPAVKGWDCTGKKEEADTLTEITNVTKAGGHVDWITMDEPLASGAGISPKSNCRLSVDQVATEVATYVQHISTNQKVRNAGAVPGFIDVEAYPATSVTVLKQFIKSLEAHGFKPAGFFLDVNLTFVQLRLDRAAAMPGDLRDLRDFMKAEHIPFGVILWPGHDPIGSDQDYYTRVIDWTKIVHQAIGAPDAAVFASWVRRCDGKTANGEPTCNKANMGCSPADKSCGHKSVPINLPDNSPRIYSHTRLVLEALGILRGQ